MGKIKIPDHHFSGQKLVKKLEARGLKNLSNLRDICLNPELSETLVAETVGLSSKKVKEWGDTSRSNNLLTGSVTTFDYHSADNPFQARYGDEWETYISKTEGCRNKVSINKLIDHMFIQMEIAFRGTTHE